MRVSIITEAGRGPGLGHIYRCLALSQAFVELDVAPSFFVNSDEPDLVPPLGQSVTIFDWTVERDRLYSLIAGSDIAVIDSYLADVDLYRAVARRVDCDVYLDDYVRIDYPDGIIWNGSVRAARLGYARKEGTRLLLGPRYIALRREFWDVPEKTIKGGIGNVMITFGGTSESDQVASAVLGLINRIMPDAEKHVVTLRAAAADSVLEKAADRNTQIHYSITGQMMRDIILRADIAVAGGGQTLYELARTGTPAIIVGIAQNQANNIEGLIDEGFAVFSSWSADKDFPSKVSATLPLLASKETRAEMATKGRRLVDGQGARRTAREVLDAARHG